MKVITSTSNTQVRRLIQLRKKARERDAEDVFLVEGPKMCREAPQDRVVHTFVSESFYQKNRSQAGALWADEAAEMTVLSEHVFETVSDTKSPQGVLCLVRQYHYEIADFFRDRGGQSDNRPLFMALESVQDPGNLGTIMRTAEAAGVSGILLDAGCADLYNPKTIRSTMGAVYRMPFYYTDNLIRELCAFQEKGVRWYAAHLRGSVPYDRADYREACGFVIGNESRGLTEETASAADVRIRIPMCGQVESLNAAVAASILMYEAGRALRR